MAEAHIVTIEDMIAEGSCTAKWAELNGYRWDCTVTLGCGDAGRLRQSWLNAKGADRG